MNHWERSSDEELLHAAKREPEAFAVFYRRYAALVLRFFLHRGAGPDVAPDLMAETFAAALAALPRFRRKPGQGAAWLFTIARRKLIDSTRRGRVEDSARRDLQIPRIALDDDALERVAALADSRGGAWSLEALLDGLPASQRDAIEARVLRELPYQEVARSLECSEQVARKRVSRGLRTLRQLYEERQ